MYVRFTLSGWTRRTQLAALAVMATLLLALLPRTVAAGPAESSLKRPDASHITHVVQPGETLSQIAVRYDISVQELIAANNINNADHIYIGQRLNIPGGHSGSSSEGCSHIHAVRYAQTLSHIAVEYGVSITVLARLNNIQRADVIYVGQQICIPASGQQGGQTGGTWYEVQRGDTLGHIALRYGTTMQALLQDNDLSNADHLLVGTRLRIRQTGAAPASSAPAPSTPAPAAPAPSTPAPVTPAPPPVRAPSTGGGFGYGIQAHMVHTGDHMIDLVMDRTQELGFGWVKQQIEWKIFESQQGQYGFGDIHPIVNRANARGINLLFSVVNAPDWAREPGFDGSVGGPPANPQVFANFLGRLASEFCGSAVKAIEVWNEQNLHYEWGNRPINPSEYMALLRPSYAAIKSACPSMLVISGALTPAGDNGSIAMDDFRYFEAMLQQGLRDYADGFGAHPSGYNVPPSHTWQTACAAIQESGNSFNGACDNPHHSWSFRSTMEGYRNLAVRYGAGGQRIWPTEFGWAAGGKFHPAYAYADDNDFDEQARWTVEAYQMMRDWGWVGPAFLWNLNFRVVADGTEKAQWGIVRNDWSPLPIFYGLRDMPK